MDMSIHSNIPALGANRQLKLRNAGFAGALQKLSSGLKVNQAKDNPAALVISELLRSQAGGIQQSMRNTQEANNVLAIAEGGLQEMSAQLSRMREMAIHALNSGVTGTGQVSADQAALNGNLSTISRIASSTSYAGQPLLNGSRGFTFDRTTSITGTTQNPLLDLGASRIDQIATGRNFRADISFQGTAAPGVAGDGQADLSKAATKAYFEADSAAGSDLTQAGTLARDVAFTLTGDQGSRAFSFNAGATVGQIASAIRNASGSTGVDAALTFASDQTHNVAATGTATAQNVGGAALRTAGSFAVFGQTTAGAGITATNAASSFGANTAIVGKNTDAQGRLWLEYTGNNTFNLYKDQSLTAESLVAHGTSGQAIVADNNSGLSGFSVTVANGANAADGSYVAVAGIEGNNGVVYQGAFSNAAAANTFRQDLTFFSGASVGNNTDAEGRVYFKTEMTGAATGQVYAYSDASMRDDSLVAQSDGAVSLAANQTVMLNEVGGSGLGVALSVGATGFASAAGDTVNGQAQFSNLGLRVMSQDYGSEGTVRIDQSQGSIFQYYSDPASAAPTVVASGASVVQTGQNATLQIDGRSVETQGLTLNLAGQNLSGRLVFNEGKAGATTIAQTGYEEGSVFTRSGALADTSWSAAPLSTGVYGSYLANPGHVTQETLRNFQGGMQFQLGETAGMQSREQVGVPSMDPANLGRVTLNGQTYSLSDIGSGGRASLANDPGAALAVIDQAISDVASARARIGAYQANTLDSNANALAVAFENITATESAIRDTDIAEEMTNFFREQLLQKTALMGIQSSHMRAENVIRLLGG